MQLLLQYTRYVAVLKWFTLSLFAYFAVLAVAHVDWGHLASSLFLPRPVWTPAYLTAVVAVFGTTIRPYLIFWQSGEEVEDMRVPPRRLDLFGSPEPGTSALHRVHVR